MIIALSIVLFVLIVTLYLSTMHSLWKQEEGKELALFSKAPFEAYAKKIQRLTRRGAYGSMLYGKIAANWGNKRFSNVFYTLFPDAQVAFAKRNNLAGLKEGPSSYFLMSISENKSEQKTTRRRQKIV